MRIVAIDCDLRRLHGWLADTETGEDQKAFYQASLLAATDQLAVLQPSTVLFECASPLFYTKNKAAQYNKLRWMIFNSKALGSLADRLADWQVPLLVAPSSIWTQGHEEKVRHRLYGVTAPNHDLRECQAMARSYLRQPKLWVPVADYVRDL